jgi:DNA-binding IclR family transcriptional regulator
VNAASIAVATRIPRETVRRRIKQLLKLGYVVEKEPSRYVLRTGILLEPRHQAAFALGIEQTVRFINELLENGVVRWVPARRARSSGKK